MRWIVTAIVSVFLLLSFKAEGRGATRIDSLISELDTVITNRSHYFEIKEARISTLKSSLASAKDDRDRFDILGNLIDEYTPYNTDSALMCSLEREAAAKKIGDPARIYNARMNRAAALSAIGMYPEVIELMKDIHTDDLPAYLHPFYYHIMRTLYGRLADYSAFEPERKRYEELTDAYRDSLMRVNEPGSLAFAISRADQLNARGRPGEALAVMAEFMDSHDLSEHDMAICAWTLSESYALQGNVEGQKEQLLVSAISDMKSAVREYISLRSLALLLYKEGDLDRAYRFLNICVEDASKSNARHRIIELNETYPMINGIYIDAMKRQKRSLQWALAIITVISLSLLAALFFIRKQMSKIAAARKTIEENNIRLNTLNSQLTESNRELCEANRSIAENSRVKETYIGRYMDQCLEYIERLDSYRKSISKLASSGKTEELKKMVKSSAAIDDELKSFYGHFDATFLKLFPTFVDDFNKLLVPEEAIVPKKPGSLTTELRIFALIRLGITDSDRIAKFLRYSITTIYNYRTRVRNKAAGDRSKLEEQVLLIGRSEH
ncbi:MAG: hypothetical protein K2G84_06850 [Muribaculaceae bacterium]|nr:hypothetical protein [Muribaculaceae bacterium]